MTRPSYFPEITVGNKYIFSKSGNEVVVVEKTYINYNNKNVTGFTVKRVNSGKLMFVPEGSLIDPTSLEE